MKVLLVMECTIGGTRRHIRELASGLSSMGHDTTAVCSAVRDPTFREDMDSMRGAGAEVIELPMRRRPSPWADLKHLFFLYRLLGRMRFDVIHTHSSKAGVLGRAAAMLRPGPALVHTPHTFAFSFKGHFNPVNRMFYLGIERFLGRQTGRIINVSESEREEALRLRIARPERLVKVENGIDPWPYRWAEPPDPENSLFMGREFFPRIGTVGLLNAAKGHDTLVRAFSMLQSRFPDAGLAIVGEGALRNRLEALVSKLGVEDSVFITGYRRDVPSLLKELDLFVLPSRWEGMPYVLMEAMASGMPAVATDVNGSRDIMEHGKTGLVVPRDDPGALASACGEIIADRDEAAAMAGEGLRRVMERFTLQSMLERTVDVYRAAIQGGRER